MRIKRTHRKITKADIDCLHKMDSVGIPKAVICRGLRISRQMVWKLLKDYPNPLTQRELKDNGTD